MLSPNVWIGDSAATKHLTGHKDGMTNLREMQTSATFGNGTSNKAAMRREILGMICNRKRVPICKGILQKVDYVPGSVFNLFSFTMLQNQGWKCTGTDNGYMLVKDGQKILFDIGIKTTEGIVWCMYFQQDGKLANVTIKGETKTCNIQQAHAQLGHMGEELTQKTAKQLEWKLSRGSLGVCEPCTIAKAKQKNLPKTKKEPSEDGQIWMYTDIATIKDKNGMPKVWKPHWCIKVLEPFGIKISNFFAWKKDMVEQSCQELSKWKDKKKKVTHVQLDNACENKALRD